MNRTKTLIIIAGCLLNILGIWSAFTLQHRYDREQATVAAQTSANNLCRAFEEHVLRTVQNIDSLLLLLRNDYQSSPAMLAERIRFYSSTSNRDLIIQVSIIDARGIMIYNNLQMPQKPLDLSDREHFRVHRENSGDSLFISKPVLGRISGKWSIQFTRRLTGRNGEFAGVIVLSVNPDYFTDFFRTINVGRQGVITLVGLDRVVRARASGEANAPIEGKGMALPAERPIFDPKKPAAGIYLVPSAIDKVLRYTAYRRLQNYPLAVLVSISREEILRPVSERRRIIFLSGIFVTIGLLAGLSIILWMERNELLLTRQLTEREEQLKSSLAEVERLATTDPLTGLLNRRAFFDESQEEFSRARRYNRDLSLIMLDLDHFKTVNDTLGHLVGDGVLRLVADIMTATVRENDIVARYGGEEFVLLLPETGSDGAMVIAERIRSAIDTTPFPAGSSGTVHCTVSLGVASLGLNTVIDDLDKLLFNADEALYRAKESGRNRVKT